MSLLSKLGRAVGGLARSPVGKTLLGTFGGPVGAAISLGATAATAVGIGRQIINRQPQPTPPMFPRPLTIPANAPSVAPNDSLSQLFENRVGRKPTGQEYAILQGLGDWGKINDAITGVNQGVSLLTRTDNTYLEDSPVMQMGLAGGAPSWGNLGRRAVGVAAPIAGRLARKVWQFIPAIGAWALVDMATGALLRVQKDKPRRRMNVLNPRALSRAHRRMDGFRGFAVKNLRHYGFTVSRSAKPRSTKKRRKC
jgi:hypothetical protein